MEPGHGRPARPCGAPPRARGAGGLALAGGRLAAGLLARFRRVPIPDIVVDLRDALLDPCLDLVQAGQVDFAVASRRPDMNELDSEFLHADRYYLVCRADHPLADASAVRLRDILRYPMIQLARGSSVRKHLDAALGADAPAPVFEVEHLATATGLVRAGLGISVVPAMTLFHFGAGPAHRAAGGQSPDAAALPRLQRKRPHAVRRRPGSVRPAARTPRRYRRPVGWVKRKTASAEPPTSKRATTCVTSKRRHPPRATDVAPTEMCSVGAGDRDTPIHQPFARTDVGRYPTPPKHVD